MSAEAVGARLLAEVQEECLSELLSAVRRVVNAPRQSGFGVPAVDRLLDIFSSPPSAEDQRLPRWISADQHHNDEDGDDAVEGHLSRGTGLLSSILLTAAPEIKPPVIHVTGPQPACGKTHLLYYLAASLTLSASHGGKLTAIAWLDTDGRFSSFRLSTILLDILTTRNPDLSQQERAITAREALSHIHVFRPQTSSQTVATLQALPSYLLDTRSHASGSRTLGAIVLDSATAFYWQDRLDAEVARLEATGTAATGGGANDTQSASSSPSKTLEIIKLLKKIQQDFGCAVLYTTTTTQQVSSSSSFFQPTTCVPLPPPPPPQQQQQPAPSPLPHHEPPPPSTSSIINPWSTYATLTLSITRIPVPQFAPHMSLEMCLRDLDSRFAAVSKGRFVVSPDWARGRSEVRGRSGVRDAVGRGAFGLRIVGDGVRVDDVGGEN